MSNCKVFFFPSLLLFLSLSGSKGDLEHRAQLREPANILIFNTTRSDTAEYRCEVAAIDDQRDFDEILISLAVRGTLPHRRLVLPGLYSHHLLLHSSSWLKRKRSSWVFVFLLAIKINIPQFKNFPVWDDYSKSVVNSVWVLVVSFKIIILHLKWAHWLLCKTDE